MDEPRPWVSLRDVHKRFGPVTALAGASLDLFPGEIHVVLGENGAGKTSLMSVLAGLYRPDSGRIEVDGRPVQFRSPRDALDYGIVMVHQHFELVANLSVWENVVLGEERSRLVLWPPAAKERVRRVAAEHGIEVDLDARVGALPVGVQQKVEILKLLYRHARLLILDEPTTFLTPQESDALLQTMRQLARQGMAVVLVTHKLRDAMAYGDRLTVMRAGRVVRTIPRDRASEDELVRLLMGEGEEQPGSEIEVPDAPSIPTGEPLLLVQGLHTPGTAGRIALSGVDLAVRQGEIHGVAGVAGNGQRELVEAVLGLLPIAAGRICIGDSDVTGWPTAERLAAGLVVIPENRIADGILPDMGLWENILLGVHRRIFPGFHLDPARGRSLGEAAVTEYQIKAPHANAPVGALSGGNIQKVLIARSDLARRYHPRPVLVAANPLRGLDLRTARQVRQYLQHVASRGGAVLLISEDLDELFALCRRISVLFRGRIVGEFAGPPYDRYRIGEAMLGRLHPAAPTAVGPGGAP